MIQRPRPVPLISLVEKKGSKIRGIFCGAIPCPESAIVTRIPFPVPLEATGLIRTVRVPPLVNASMELPMRLAKAWRISEE
jgi:hypothetical protein